MQRNHFYLFALFYVTAVVYLAWTTPISPHEAKLLYAGHGIVSILLQAGHSLYDGLIGIRFFFLLIGFLSIYLYYRVSWIYLERDDDRHLATAVYMMLPGIVTAQVLANIAILVIPLVLLFLLAYEKRWIWLEALLMLILFVIHDASVIFFLATFIYALIRKEAPLGFLSGLFLLLSLVIDRGVEIGGRPSGHFLDIFALYAALFSPLVFLYFFYTLYRILLREEKNILWYISFISLVASLLLSIRQRVSVTDFAPYVIVSIVLMVDIFNRSIRVRLPEFQKRYRWGFYVVIFTLFLSTLTIIFHQAFFPFLKDPREHFAYRLYQPYWLAEELRKDHLDCYDARSDSVQRQLRFYGIARCSR